MSSKRERVIELAKKLAARSVDPSSAKAEVEMAARSLQKLIRKHGLTEDELQSELNKARSLTADDVERIVISNHANHVPKIATLTVQVVSLMFDSVNPMRERVGRRHLLVLYGIGDDLRDAAEMFHVLLNTSKKYARSRGFQSKQASSYRMGFVSGIGDVVYEANEQIKDSEDDKCTELMCIKSSLVKQVTTSIRTGTFKPKAPRVDPHSYMQGKSDGYEYQSNRHKAICK